MADETDRYWVGFTSKHGLEEVLADIATVVASHEWQACGLSKIVRDVMDELKSTGTSADPKELMQLALFELAWRHAIRLRSFPTDPAQTHGYLPGGGPRYSRINQALGPLFTAVLSDPDLPSGLLSSDDSAGRLRLIFEVRKLDRKGDSGSIYLLAVVQLGGSNDFTAQQLATFEARRGHN